MKTSILSWLQNDGRREFSVDQLKGKPFSFVEIKKNVGMALVYKLHKQGGSDNTAPFPHNHLYISI